MLGEVQEEEESQELAKYICKIYIPNEERAECLRHLRMMNVHHASLFPDLLGASQFCNIMVAEEALDYRQTEIARKAEHEPVEMEIFPATPEIPTTEVPMQSLRDVLAEPESAAGVEPARLGLMAEELVGELAKKQYVDWEKRDSVKAAMRNAARVVLRRLGYPADAREAVLDQLLAAFKAEAAGEH